MKILVLTVVLAVVAFRQASSAGEASMKDLTANLEEFIKNPHPPVNTSEASGRISGGSSVQPGELPFLSSVWICERNNPDFCAYFASASLVKKNFLLTSGMACETIKEEMDLFDFYVMTNTNFLYLWDSGIRQKISAIRVPPGFNVNTYHHNLCILEVAEPFSESIAVAELPNILECICNPYTKPKTNTNLTVAGWGYTGRINLGFPNEAQKTVFSTIGNGDCQAFYNDTVMDGMVCAQGTRGKNLCEGDTGAPAISSDGVIRAIGTASADAQHCETNDPVVLTRLCPFLDWIHCQIGGYEWDWGEDLEYHQERCMATRIPML